MHKLEEVATRQSSNTAWDRLAFLPKEEQHWWQEVLSHYLGKTLDVGTHMPGFWLMIQDEEGCYSIATHALKFKGSMFIYDPQRDISQWVLVRGTSSALTLSELRVANDLNIMNPFPCDATGLIQPWEHHSPMLVQGIPVGAELTQIALMNLNRRTQEMSGIKPNVVTCRIVLLCLWTKDTHGQRLPQKCEGRSSGEMTLPLGRRHSHSKHKDAQKEDSDWDDDPHGMVESHFGDATVADEVGMDTAEDCTAGPLPTGDTARALPSEDTVKAPPL